MDARRVERHIFLELNIHPVTNLGHLLTKDLEHLVVFSVTT